MKHFLQFYEILPSLILPMLNCLLSLNSCVSLLVRFYRKKKKKKLKIHVFFLMAAIGEGVSFLHHKKKATNGGRQVTITMH